MKSYKNHLLRITPSNIKSFYLKDIENGNTYQRAYQKSEMVRSILTKAYSKDPSVKTTDGYKLGECKVSDDNYSWYVGKTLMINYDGNDNTKEIDVWYTINRKSD